MNNLVLVESPTKSKTLQRFLGPDYRVEATMGHIRDLPKSEMGIDIEHNFEPQYIVPTDKRKKVNELKKYAKEAKTLWLATDPDREGEAIAWHIAELLGGKEMHRVEFHEITEGAIKAAFEHPREIDLKLVDAQQARRVLDRLVGYKLSPLLWVKVKKGLSAGRVQSVALRLIVEREREVLVFNPVEYWTIEAELTGNSQQSTDKKFIATLIERNGKRLEINNEKQSKEHLANLEKATYVVSKVTKKEVRRYPYAPFTTSTLQQTAANRLGMSAKKTMMLAQALYERGLITYMRTDAVNLSAQAITMVRDYIGDLIGKAYLPSSARVYKAKSKNAQEAHEAIRPTNVSLQSSGISLQTGLNRDHTRLYDLIWKRFVACQMSEAIMDQTSIDVIARSEATKQSLASSSEIASPPKYEILAGRNDGYLLRATGSVIKFDGWLKLYGKDVEEESEDEKKQVLPQLEENQPLNLLQLLPGQHFTEPPPRFNEASLIKKLEELGIGRPSTYAPIISTIQDRFYVEKQERKFIPTHLGFAVCDFLIQNFPDVFDYQFTAHMEDELDEIANGRPWKPIIADFYKPFEKRVEETAKTAQKVKVELEVSDKKCPECGKDLVVRIGKFGKFLACSGFPACKHTEALEEKVNAICPEDGGEIVIRHTKKGKTFYGCKNWPTCKYASWTKPKTATPEPAVSPEVTKLN